MYTLILNNNILILFTAGCLLVAVNDVGKFLGIWANHPFLFLSTAQAKKSEPLKILPKPFMVELKAITILLKPFMVEPKTTKVFSQPFMVYTKTTTILLKPFMVEPKTIKVLPKPFMVEPKTIKVLPKPFMVEPKPLKVAFLPFYLPYFLTKNNYQSLFFNLKTFILCHKLFIVV